MFKLFPLYLIQMPGSLVYLYFSSVDFEKFAVVSALIIRQMTSDMMGEVETCCLQMKGSIWSPQGLLNISSISSFILLTFQQRAQKRNQDVERLSISPRTMTVFSP